MAWITPKLDWTSDDFFNYEDLNRIESNSEEVASLIALFGSPPNIDTVTSRDMKHIEFLSSLQRVDSNIRHLAERYKPQGWRDDEMNIPIDYRDVNRWEQNLYLLFLYYRGNADAIPCCGMLYCGEEAV